MVIGILMAQYTMTGMYTHWPSIWRILKFQLGFDASAHVSINIYLWVRTALWNTQ